MLRTQKSGEGNIFLQETEEKPLTASKRLLTRMIQLRQTERKKEMRQEIEKRETERKRMSLKEYIKRKEEEKKEIVSSRLARMFFNPDEKRSIPDSGGKERHMSLRSGGEATGRDPIGDTSAGPEGEGMKLTPQRLEKMITEVFEEVLAEQFGLREEEKKKEKKEKSPQKKPSNPWHSAKTGRFTDPEKEDTCWSLFFSEPSKGRARSKAGSRRQLSLSQPSKSGRGESPSGKGEWKCSTNQKLREEDGNIVYRSVNCRQTAVDRSDEMKEENGSEKPVRTIVKTIECDLQPASPEYVEKKKRKETQADQKAARYLQQAKRSRQGRQN